MPRIRCAYEDCAFLDEHYCTAVEVEFDPDHGCLTYKPMTEVLDSWQDEDDLLDDDLPEDDFLDDEDFWDDDL